MQNIAIIGSTGSVGRQTVDVLKQFPHLYKVAALACNKNTATLSSQTSDLNPKTVCIFDDKSAAKFQQKFSGKKTAPKIISGKLGLMQIAKNPSIDKIFFVSDGLDAAEALFEAIKNHKQIALANKELLVAYGPKIMKMAKQIIPIDSEHSAIFQCLQGEDPNAIEKIVLTCSGGPFYGYSKTQLKSVTLDQTLNHPTWRMGDEITVNSATLMNKAFEIIEAAHLFNLNPTQIEVVIHPESIIHSLVYFKDGSVKAQMSLPDMRHAIQYALTYPARLDTNLKKLDLLDLKKLTFLKPDFDIFEGPKFAYDLLKNYSSDKAIKLIKANEQAVNLFLNQKIKFHQIYEIIKKNY